MSRFVDPTAVERLSLGPCDCPGAPHGEDWVDLRTQLSGQDWYTIASGNTERALGTIVAGWSFEDAAGPIPVTSAAIAALDFVTFKAIDDWIEANLQAPSLPNASAAPSRGSSRASGSRTRKAKTDGSSTTPSWSAAASPSTTSGSPIPS